MSAEKIIKQIKHDSQKEVDAILQQAHTEAEQILNQAEQQAKQQATRLLEEGKRQSENLKKIQLSKASQEMKRQIMSEQEKLIDECFIKAQHELSKLSDHQYKTILRNLMRDGQQRLGKHCTVKISRPIDKQIASDLGIEITGSIESSGGVILVSDDGRIILDYTFEGILKREKQTIRIKVGKLLFS